MTACSLVSDEYSPNRNYGRLFNFGPMRVGAYSRVGAYYFFNIFNKRGYF